MIIDLDSPEPNLGKNSESRHYLEPVGKIIDWVDQGLIHLEVVTVVMERVLVQLQSAATTHEMHQTGHSKSVTSSGEAIDALDQPKPGDLNKANEWLNGMRDKLKPLALSSQQTLVTAATCCHPKRSN